MRHHDRECTLGGVPALVRRAEVDAVRAAVLPVVALTAEHHGLAIGGDDNVVHGVSIADVPVVVVAAVLEVLG